MTNQDEVERATEIFEEMYREEVYVDVEGSNVMLEFDRYLFEVNLWSGSRWLIDRETDETILEESTYF